MVSVAKKSLDKISIGGRKFALRRLDATASRRPRSSASARRPRTTATTAPLLVELVRDGEVVGREPLDDARDRHRASRAELPWSVQQMSKGEPVIPTIILEATCKAEPMALVTCDFFSDVLEVGCSMTVVLPQPTEEQIGVAGQRHPATDFPVLYLLHGLSDDHTAWLRYTSVERYAAAAGLAVVMPAVNRSFYANEVNGGRYWDYIADELPGIVGTSSGSPRTRRRPTSPACPWAATAR